MRFLGAEQLRVDVLGCTDCHFSFCWIDVPKFEKRVGELITFLH